MVQGRVDGVVLLPIGHAVVVGVKEAIGSIDWVEGPAVLENRPTSEVNFPTVRHAVSVAVGVQGIRRSNRSGHRGGQGGQIGIVNETVSGLVAQQHAFEEGHIQALRGGEGSEGNGPVNDVEVFDVELEPIHVGLPWFEHAVKVHVETVTVRIFETVAAVERVHAHTPRIIGAKTASFPAVGHGVAIRVRIVWIGFEPCLRRLRRFTVGVHHVAPKRQVAHDAPLVLANVGQSVSVCIPQRIVRTHRVKGPIVAAVKGRAHPTPVLDFPTVRHPVAVGIWIGGVRGRIGRCVVDVGLVGRRTHGTVAAVGHLEVVVAPQGGGGQVEGMHFGAVRCSVHVGVRV